MNPALPKKQREKRKGGLKKRKGWVKEFIFIVGGARSGKSRYAQALAKRISKKVAFIATCTPQDKEMKKRIALHQKARPRHWKVIEEPREIKSILPGLKEKFDVVIIDCLGLLISNFLSTGLNERAIEKEITLIAGFLSKAKFTSIVVSNEVGGGIVPGNALARRFRDLAGFSNQIMAKRADRVIFMQSGIPMKIKGE
ncbi:MAG: bifunctional adenosylcobinamide kinase/adenosylcobinamide-phosphate guanylyltransferase [Candidatus Omnitrophica bacterium]|nr:bifunctional adenosylcobinamide kinase/adenosylcobinamide-phosphate guanylyltransferase [Candidatus Omnitrophota bacterium]